MASSSQWIWDPTYSLYYNPSTQQWATIGAAGEWVYANANDPQHASATATRDVRGPAPAPASAAAHGRSAGLGSRSSSSSSASATAKGKRRYYDRDDPDFPVELAYTTAVPEEQVWPFSDDEYYDDHRDPLHDGGKWIHDRHDPSLDGVAAPLLRLVVDRSGVLQKDHVILIPPDEPVQLGRDKAFDKRIRLKELPVSKTHATLFFTPTPFDIGIDGGEWQVVDGGSTHGTFVKTTSSPAKWVRLSRDKVASGPKTLHHLDLLRIGSTSFSIHIHPSLPCSACSIRTDGSNLIPLSTSKDHRITSATTDGPTSLGPTPYTAVTKEQKELERRERIKGLKEQYRIGPGSKNSTAAAPAEGNDGVDLSLTRLNKTQFIDRAKIRRELNLGAGEGPSPSSTKTTQRVTSGPFFTVPGANAAHSVVSASSIAPPIDPFGSQTKGAKLLAKVGGITTGGAGSLTTTAASTMMTSNPRGLGQLIDPKVLNGDARSGLGSRPLKALLQPVVVNDAKSGGWREDVREASRKRWKEMEGKS